MADFIVAIGLVLVIEGILYALFPVFMQNMMRMAISQDEGALRKTGLIALVLGVIIIYAVK